MAWTITTCQESGPYHVVTTHVAGKEICDMPIVQYVRLVEQAFLPVPLLVPFNYWIDKNVCPTNFIDFSD